VTDRLLGVIFGVARGLVIVFVLVAVGGMTSVPKEKWWSEAQFSAPLETAVLASKPWLPPEMAKRIRFR
jgi:membrane protein required for colicin V production